MFFLFRLSLLSLSLSPTPPPLPLPLLISYQRGTMIYPSYLGLIEIEAYKQLPVFFTLIRQDILSLWWLNPPPYNKKMILWYKTRNRTPNQNSKH